MGGVTKTDIKQLFAHAAKERARREAAEAKAKAGPGRGTTNKNQRGGSDDRRRRREWLVLTYRADVDLFFIQSVSPYTGNRVEAIETAHGKGEPACRCYRCGMLLTVETVTVDRIVPGAKGGTYARNNIRPACARCNSETGGAVRR